MAFVVQSCQSNRAGPSYAGSCSTQVVGDRAITHISVALQRNNARRILAAHNRCQKEALCHRHPAGALGTPTTVFAAVVEKAQKRRLRPGMVWKDRETPLGSPKARVARNAAGEA